MGDDPGIQRGKAAAIVRRTAATAVRCRCGTTVPPGDSFFEVVGLPPAQEGPFEGQSFCSLACLRAFYLETMSILEGLDSPEAQEVVTDLRATYLELSATFSRMLDEWYASWYLSARQGPGARP